MSSGTEIIQTALQRIGVHSVAAPASPEAIVSGKDMLNSMLQMWQSIGVELGAVPLNAPGDELGEPMDARAGIIDNLAIYMAPEFSNGKQIVSPELSRSARIGYAFIKKMYQSIEIPKKKMSSTMPLGAGSTRGNHAAVFINGSREIGD